MGLRPTQGYEKRLGPASTLYGTATLSLSSRPERRDLRFLPMGKRLSTKGTASAVPKRTVLMRALAPEVRLSDRSRRILSRGNRRLRPKLFRKTAPKRTAVLPSLPTRKSGKRSRY
jgi:hypothetical protein